MSRSVSDSYNKNRIPKTRFTGVFIPAEILEMEELNPTEIILLSWIDALYDEEHGGCFAGNEYLAKKLHLKEKSVSDVIAKLIRLELVEKVSFDGRTRVIRVCKIKYHQPEADSGLNRKQDPEISGSSMRLNPEPHLIYSKEESKDNMRGNASGHARQKFGSHVALYSEEYDKLCKENSKSQIDDYISRINDYCQSKRPKGYSVNGYAATIRNWIRKDKETPNSKSKANIAGERLEEYDGKW